MASIASLLIKEGLMYIRSIFIITTTIWNIAHQQGKLYMEYKKAGSKTWKRTGYMTANAIKLYTSQNYTISGLKPNTKYNIRIRYGDYVTYDTRFYGDGKSYFFGGPVLKCGTIQNRERPKRQNI